MMEKQAAARVDEWLSAYLDGELSPQERARMEARLAAEPELRARLESLRQTVALLHSMPAVPAPRNFILTPAMVRQERPARAERRWLLPALSLGTAISALASVVVLALSVLGAWPSPSTGLTATGPAYEVAMESTEAPAAAPLEGAAGDAQGDVATSAPEGTLGGLDADVPPPTVTPMAARAVPVDVFTATVVGTATGGGAAAEGLGGGAPPPGIAAAEAVTVAEEVNATLMMTESVVVALPEEESLPYGVETPPVTQERLTAPVPQPTAAPAPRGAAPWYLEIGLPALTLVLAVVSLLVWRAARR